MTRDTIWRKGSTSDIGGGGGGSDCVEVAWHTDWFKSSASNSGGDTCVEVRITANQVGVRDSKKSTAGAFWVPPDAWTSFLTKWTNRMG